jgi:O-Antigen ligase
MAGMATVGMTGVRIAGWTASDLFFLAASFVIVLRLLTATRRNLTPVAARRSSPGVLIGLVVLSIGALLATVGRSIDAGASALALARVWYITIVWFWTMRSVSTSVRTFRRLLVAVIVGAVLHAFVGIWQDVSGANAGAPGWGRSIGFSDHYNDLGLALASVIPILAVWRPARRVGPRWTLVRIVALLVLFGGLGSSGSISAMGAAIVGTLVAARAPSFAERRRRRSRQAAAVPVIAVLVAAVLVAGGLVDLSVQDRFTELVSGDSPTSQSAESRTSLAEVAIDGIVSSPLVGTGLDTRSGFVEAESGTNLVHNFYLRITYQAGILGFLGLCLILFMVGWQVRQVLRYTRGSPLISLPAGLLGSLVAVLVAAMFGPFLYARIAWLPMALTNALYGLARAGRLDRAPSADGSQVRAAARARPPAGALARVTAASTPTAPE